MVSKKRITIVFVLFCLALVLILSKAFYIQVVNRAKLLAFFESQTIRTYKVYSNRGDIYDRNGRPLAINIKTYSIFTIPKNVKNGLSSYRTLTEIVPSLDFQQIKMKILKRNKYTWIARKIQLSDEQVAKIKEIEGIYIEKVPKRFYPNNEMASQILGFVGVDNSGLAGVEYLFDEDLKGGAKVVKYFKDAKGRPVKFENEENKKAKSKDIHLSIDIELQAIAEKYLRKMVLESQAKMGGVGIIDVISGELLALANYPTFDPNNLKKSNSKDRKLSFATDPIEPGSIFKILTVASALEQNIAKPDTNYYCERGRLKVEDHIISEAESVKKYEWLSVSDIIKHSSNVGTTKLAFDLTYPRLKKTLDIFGIGEKTGVEIPGESRGIGPTTENVSPLSLSNISFGQGIAVTGIQMLSVYATIANRGILVRPTLLKNRQPSEPLRVLRENTAIELEKMLIEAVEDGTGKNAKIEHFTIAGKTSTAQRPDGQGGYTGYIPGFIGYPVNVDNKFVIYVYIDGPQGEKYYGNQLAAPVFKEIAQHILYNDKRYHNFAKQSETKTKFVIDKIEVKNAASKKYGQSQIPNLKGLDKKTVQQILEKMGLKAQHRGIGVVSEQFPEPGEKIQADVELKILYRPPKYE
ncbi:MAG: PASTA domain-containing protein [Halobacteriovoraceae bacterium]|nr:PASTA domain-containing protein [Halobacteriovoraceae bacterium]